MWIFFRGGGGKDYSIQIKQSRPSPERCFLGRVADPVARAADPVGRVAVPLGRVAVPIGRATDPVGRAADPGGGDRRGWRSEWR